LEGAALKPLTPPPNDAETHKPADEQRQCAGRSRFNSRSPASWYAIFSYIEGWYKPARRHSGIRYSPMAYETQMLKETQTT
jgi:hypothetical protein